MREQIRSIIDEWVTSKHGRDQATNQILTLIREEIEKCLLADEEVDKQYLDGWAKRNTEVDSPLDLKAEDGDEYIDVLRELAQAQLDEILKVLEEE